MTIDTLETFDEGPFAEALAPAAEPTGFTQWSGGAGPFAETPLGLEPSDGALTLIAEAIDAVRDESFDEALADLVAETEAAISDRFDNESGAYAAERERIGDSHLGPVGLEAERYFDVLAERLADQDLASLTSEAFDALLDSLDPQTSPLSPASEQFLGGLIRKAKSAVKFVVKTAKSAASTVGKVAGGLLAPVLGKLRALIRPLLKRVLSFAIGRLPEPLRGPARALASRLGMAGEYEDGNETWTVGSPTVSTSPEALAEQFDTAIAEITVGTGEGEEPEAFGLEDNLEESAELERLAQSRAELIQHIRSAEEGEDLAPAIENFIPALLGALRVGINLVGRSRVVGFLASFLGDRIRRFTGPSLSRPLATAIVDTGLRMVSLEADEADSGEAAATALAATVEDTIRRLAECENYMLENDELLQLGTADAFEQAVATNFPARLVKASVQQAPTLSGSFVTRRAKRLHPFRRYSRVPEVELTEQVADGLRTFGGTTVGSELRAAGVTFPVRARLHIFEAVVGTTVPAITAADSRLSRLGQSSPWQKLHPLTQHAAGLVLREPRLGADVSAAFLQSRGRVATGQRFFSLEPVGSPAPTGAGGAPQTLATGAGGLARTGARTVRARASQARLRFDLRAGTIRVAVFLSERDSQTVAAQIRQGRGVPALLTAISRTFNAVRFAAGDRSVVVRREAPDTEELSARLFARLAPSAVAAVQRQVRAWFMTMIADWAKTRAEEFARASSDPSDGVTVALTLSAVPGISVIADAVSGRASAGVLSGLVDGSALRGTPSGAVVVSPGRHLR